MSFQTVTAPVAVDAVGSRLRAEGIPAPINSQLATANIARRLV